MIIPVEGQMRVGIYDDRADSPSFETFRALEIAAARPVAIYVPSGVWHAIKNPTSESAAYVVVNDKPFDYEEPDDWTVSMGSHEFPYDLD